MNTPNVQFDTCTQLSKRNTVFKIIDKVTSRVSIQIASNWLRRTPSLVAWVTSRRVLSTFQLNLFFRFVTNTRDSFNKTIAYSHKRLKKYEAQQDKI